MIYYVIRQKSTGLFMPQQVRHRGRTHDEPKDGPPRLFTRERDAKIALDWWLDGEAYVEHGYDQFGEGDIEDWKCRKRPDRKKEDMEIVPVNLAVIMDPEEAVRRMKMLMHSVNAATISEEEAKELLK